MNDDVRTAVRSALMLLRDHARQRLSQYATRHRMRPTGWHFMIDASSGAGTDTFWMDDVDVSDIVGGEAGTAANSTLNLDTTNKPAES